MELIWVFLLTLGISDETTIEVEYRARTEGACVAGRDEIMQIYEANSSDVLYWYITPCERDSRWTD